jgi:hypothetical protein
VSDRLPHLALPLILLVVQACKAVAPGFYHLAIKNPNVVFVDVPVTPQNANLHQGLGVPSLPFGHIYHPQDGLVEELRLTKSLLPQFEEKLNSFVNSGNNNENGDDKQI